MLFRFKNSNQSLCPLYPRLGPRHDDEPFRYTMKNCNNFRLCLVGLAGGAKNVSFQNRCSVYIYAMDTEQLLRHCLAVCHNASSSSAGFTLPRRRLLHRLDVLLSSAPALKPAVLGQTFARVPVHQLFPAHRYRIIDTATLFPSVCSARLAAPSPHLRCPGAGLGDPTRRQNLRMRSSQRRRQMTV